MKYQIHARMDEKSLVAKEKLNELLQQRGYEASSEPHLLFTIGGDGTVLHAIQENLSRLDQLVIVPIHTGTLGFLTNYTVAEFDQLLADLKNPLTCKRVNLLQAECFDERDVLRHLVFGLNEIRVENILKTQVIDVMLNDQVLERFRGNGLCVSGQMGSTAYNRSINGAIIDESVAALQLTEISGIHHQHYRSLYSSLILNPKTVITLSSASYEGAKLVYDYLNIDLHVTKKIVIRQSDLFASFLCSSHRNYYDRLRTLF